MSARAKFAGFLLLLAGVFGGAYAAGAHVGPVATTPSQRERPGRRVRDDAHGRARGVGPPPRRRAVSDTSELTGEQIEFVVSGMSCGACAARIERRLNRLDGVVATVNFVTERAYVTRTGGRDPDELISVIESVGYGASRPGPAAPEDAGRDDAARSLLERLAVCVPLAVAVIVLAMAPALQFPGWQWLSLLLAGIVASWGAWPLHRAAWAGLGHGTATMDTLVSVGVSASFLWSLYALLLGGAGRSGMRMPYAVTFAPASGHTLYLDVAAGVTAAVLSGRYLEARAKRQAGSALAALASLAARTVCILTRRPRGAGACCRAARRRPVRGPPGGEDRG